MLKLVHRYQRSIIATIIILIICLAMIGFGVDFMTPQTNRYALKVGETEISFSDFYKRQRELDEMYRLQFGDYYYQLKQQQGWDLRKMLIDGLIPSLLLEQLADSFGFSASPSEIMELAGKSLPGGATADILQAYLRQIGKTGTAFEAELGSRSIVNQFDELINLASRASKAEANALLLEHKTSYSASALAFDPNKYRKQVEQPQLKELESFYVEHATDFELPPRISYDFVVFSPSDYYDSIEITEDDVELYYSDHSDQFSNPARAKIRHIQLNFSESDSPEEMAAVKKQAEQLLKEIQSGEDFDKLALAHSDDLLTNTSGGVIGWVDPGQQPAEIDAAVFKLAKTGLTDLVETNYGFHIIRIDEFKEPSPKPLKDVRTEIVKQLKHAEAPGYASVEAQELFDRWQASNSNLAELARAGDLKIERVSLADKGSDPNSKFPGLTAKVMTFPDEHWQLIEFKDQTIIAEVTEYRESEIPALTDQREKVLEAYTKERAEALARAAATKSKEEVEKGLKSLEQAAVSLEMELLKQPGLLRTQPATGPFSNEELRKDLFGSFQPGLLPRIYTIEGRFHLVEIEKIEQPDLSLTAPELNDYLKRATELNNLVLQKSLINKLKSKTDVDVDPTLLVLEE